MFFAYPLIILALLAACSNLPDANQAQKEAERIATEDAIGPELFKVTNLVRENGWAEGENRYLIRYNWNIVSQKPYPQMLIERLKMAEDEIKNTSEADLTALRTNLMAFSGSFFGNFFKQQGQLSAYDATVAMLTKYPEVKTHLQSRAAAFRNDNVIMLIALSHARETLDAVNLPEDAPSGHVLSRTITFTYIKTEKGWIKSK